jgi:hypothetical protein
MLHDVFPIKSVFFITIIILENELMYVKVIIYYNCVVFFRDVTIKYFVTSNLLLKRRSVL